MSSTCERNHDVGFSTDLYIDRDISARLVVKAFSRALNLKPGQVASLPVDDFDARQESWADPVIRVLVLKTTIPGDFPLGLDLRMKDDRPADFDAFVSSISKTIGAPVLTDETGIDPAFADDWFMVTPDGAKSVVTADSEALAADVPALRLTPQSRLFYEAHRGTALAPTG